MEWSSPLATIQPSMFAHPWANRKDLPNSRNFFNGNHNFPAGNFNFRDLSMKRPPADYFSVKPVRSSSPAASLAADLSQNFHIDHSPHPSTPRRCLFTSTSVQTSIVNEGTITPPIRLEGMTTPPIPSSSPAPGIEPMEISPLPHKAPFTSTTKLVIPSPKSSLIVPTQQTTVSSECQNAREEEPMTSILANERKKPHFPRPALTRLKGFSTNTIPLSKTTQEQLPPFKFGAMNSCASSLALPSMPSLEECFTESPPQDRKSGGIQLMGPIKTRQLSFGSNGNRMSGSPINGHVRRSSARVCPPRKQFRRSLSMFESPKDVMKQEKRDYIPSNLQSAMDADDAHTMTLPHFMPDSESDSLPRINHGTFIEVLDGRYDANYDKALIIDCRFEYEYNGGHIENALNFTDKESLAQDLFRDTQPNARVLLVFHCEYSAHRAPIMAKFIRNRDRAANDYRYPKLTFPEMYILDGGYSCFFKAHQTRCFPQNYVEMAAKEHERACERGMNKLKQRTKLARAQTFAFGQQPCSVEESPTVQGNLQNFSLPSNDVCDSSPLDMRSFQARRMPSY